jgi:hypothetical protein
MQITSRTRRPIAPIEGERYSYFAPSDTFGQPPWKVDLESHNGEGECACPDWDLVKRINRREGERNPDKIQCKHLKRCFVHFAVTHRTDTHFMSWRELLDWGRREVKKEIRKKRNELPGRTTRSKPHLRARAR